MRYIWVDVGFGGIDMLRGFQGFRDTKKDDLWNKELRSQDL